MLNYKGRCWVTNTFSQLKKYTSLFLFYNDIKVELIDMSFCPISSKGPGELMSSLCTCQHL